MIKKIAFGMPPGAVSKKAGRSTRSVRGKSRKWNVQGQKALMSAQRSRRKGGQGMDISMKIIAIAGAAVALCWTTLNPVEAGVIMHGFYRDATAPGTAWWDHLADQAPTQQRLSRLCEARTIFDQLIDLSPDNADWRQEFEIVAAELRIVESLTPRAST